MTTAVQSADFASSARFRALMKTVTPSKHRLDSSIYIYVIAVSRVLICNVLDLAGQLQVLKSCMPLKTLRGSSKTSVHKHIAHHAARVSIPERACRLHLYGPYHPARTLSLNVENQT